MCPHSRIFFGPSKTHSKVRVSAAKKQMQATRGDLFPSLSLFAGYGTSYFETNVDEDGNVIPFKTQFNDNQSKFVGAQLNIPITNGWANHSRVKQQKIAYMQAKNNLEIQEQELFKLLKLLIYQVLNLSVVLTLAYSFKKFLIECSKLKGLIRALFFYLSL